MILIGLGHKARQGKNYVADFMKAEDNRVQTYAFADELKLYCKEHHDQLVPQWQLWHQTKQYPIQKADPIYGYTPILQWYGSEIARKENPDVWIEALDRRLFQESPQIGVITDCRFKNEAKYIKDSGGIVVEVIRRNQDGTQYIDPGRDSSHISEVDLKDYLFDFVIDCTDGDFEDLEKKAIGVLNCAKTYKNSYVSSY